MKERRKVEENHLAQQLPWLINNVHFCYDGNSSANNDDDKNNTFYSIKKVIKIPKKLTQMGQRAWKEK